MSAQVYGGRWQIDKTLGEGGQAHTFLVTDIQGGGSVQYVLKRLKNTKNIRRLDRFRQEVDVVRGLSHQNIVKLVDFDTETTQPYLVMEYCVGGDLESHRGRWIDDTNGALDLFIQICDGVAAAHAQGIVHRDLKPANILLRSDAGPAVVADFGICYYEDGQRQTLTDEAVGPRLYIAPELDDGRSDEVSPRSDVYALGKVLYWLLTGGKIFGREKHREQEFDLTILKQDGRLENVNRMLDKMVTANPNDRFTDASSVAYQARQLANLIRGRYNVPGSKVPQPCMYCGQGKYVVKVKGRQTGNWGITAMANNDWRILMCNVCGHVQMFRPDLADAEDLWK